MKAAKKTTKKAVAKPAPELVVGGWCFVVDDPNIKWGLVTELSPVLVGVLSYLPIGGLTWRSFRRAKLTYATEAQVHDVIRGRKQFTNPLGVLKLVYSAFEKYQGKLAVETPSELEVGEWCLVEDPATPWGLVCKLFPHTANVLVVPGDEVDVRGFLRDRLTPATPAQAHDAAKRQGRFTNPQHVMDNVWQMFVREQADAAKEKKAAPAEPARATPEPPPAQPLLQTWQHKTDLQIIEAMFEAPGAFYQRVLEVAEELDDPCRDTTRLLENLLRVRKELWMLCSVLRGTKRFSHADNDLTLYITKEKKASK